MVFSNQIKSRRVRDVFRNDIKYNLIKPFWLVVKVVMFV